jgi:uncharacterized protein
MSFRAIWADRTPYRKFLILLGLVLLCTFFSLTVFYMLIKPVFGLDLVNNPNLINDFSNATVVNAWRLMQIIQTIGFFIIPPFLMVYFSYREGNSYLSINVKPSLIYSLLIIAVIFSAIPLINWLGYWNERITLPPGMAAVEEWMKNSEKQLGELSKVLLKAESPSVLLLNIFMIALLPAIGEELLFRGLIQKMFGKWTKNIHLAIIISAVLFSAMHRQFYGFFPRMLLGVLFGYLLVWSGSLWVPIIGHFINNATAVIVNYIIQNYKFELPIDTIGTRPGDILILITSTTLVSFLIYLMYKKRRHYLPD